MLDFKGVALPGRSKVVISRWPNVPDRDPSVWVHFMLPSDIPGFINQICTTANPAICKEQVVVDDEVTVIAEAGSSFWQGYTGDSKYLALPYSHYAHHQHLLQMSIHLPNYQFSTTDLFCAKNEIDALARQIQLLAPVEFKATLHVNFSNSHGRSFGKEKGSTYWTSHSW